MRIPVHIRDRDVFQHPYLYRILTGVRRLEDYGGTRERLLVTKDNLMQLSHAIILCTRPSRVRSIHLAWDLLPHPQGLFSRRRVHLYLRHDVTLDQWQLTRRSIQLCDEELDLSRPSSKIDPFRRWTTFTIAATGDAAYAVVSLRNIFSLLFKPLSKPLFELANEIFARNSAPQPCERKQEKSS